MRIIHHRSPLLYSQLPAQQEWFKVHASTGWGVHQMSLTAKRLRELLHYNPQTGIFVWLDKQRAKKSTAGRLRAGGYVDIKVDYISYSGHALAWLYVTGKWPHQQIDHIDTVKFHNWWSNLRLATPSQQQANTKLRPNNTSGYKGVYWSKQAQRWMARVKKNGKFVHQSRHTSPEAAHAAYVRAAEEAFGEFARAA